MNKIPFTIIAYHKNGVNYAALSPSAFVALLLGTTALQNQKFGILFGVKS